MKIILLLLLLKFSDFTSPPSYDANAKFSQTDLYELREKSIIRVILSESNGGIVANARDVYFYGIGNDKSPLRNTFYHSQDNLQYFGHARCSYQQSMIFRPLQAYEINTIRIRFWDQDNRIHNFKIFIMQALNSPEELLYEGSVHGLIIIKFSDRMVYSIRAYSNGNSLDGNMSIIKVQAYYAF